MNSEPNQTTKPLLALTLGDPAGIGPEIVRTALLDPRVHAAAQLILIGSEQTRPTKSLAPFEFQAVGPGESWEMGQAQASAGRVALASLARGAELAASGAVNALVTAPVNKEALWLAGEEVEGQTTLLGRWAGVDVDMLAVAGPLRVLLATRHMPLRAALDAITIELVVTKLGVLDRGLRRLGIESPKLALPGLNPHAGENGILGAEDDAILRPAVEQARAQGIDVSGPFSPDTIFLRAYRAEFDGVLGLYHDQAFIPTKLIAPDSGLTVLFELPYLRVSPAHGTAFDIVGQGLASANNLIEAILQAAEWARAKNRLVSVRRTQ